MKKTIICGIPMKENLDEVVFRSNDKSLPTANHPVRYPINAFIEKTMKPEDDIKFVLIVKDDKYGYQEKNLEYFKAESEKANSQIGAKISYKIINNDFSQNRLVHEQLLEGIIDELDVGSHIIVDSTYGPKDLPIVIFTALNFAEKFMNCEIENIIYGQASFEKGHVVDARLCDMMPLYCLGAITNTIHQVEPEKAKAMLKSLLSI